MLLCMSQPPSPPQATIPTLEEMQHWTSIIGRMQQLLLEYALSPEGRAAGERLWEHWRDPQRWPTLGMVPSAMPATAAMQSAAGFAGPDNPLLSATTSFWQESVDLFQTMMNGGLPAAVAASDASAARDRRFAAEEWREQPFFAFVRQCYQLVAERMLATADGLEGVDPKVKAQLRFATANIVDAISPSNFPLTNPVVVNRTLEERGENLVRGLEYMLRDLKQGQLTHVDTSRFVLGENIANTPGKVIHETRLYQLIQYAPTTEDVIETPLVIFPPWINRFYILDLNAEKSFIRWAVGQGLTVFAVSWKSADASMADIVWDDYVEAQIDAITTIKAVLGVAAVHTIGYCVAGTTLAATLALLAAQGADDAVASATFFTAQVDFSEAGELSLLVDDTQLALIEQVSGEGFLDGRYMAATFNALRGRDLIWNYVVNHYMLGEEYPPFDLLYWNGDTTNLPAKWHKAYLTDLYRDNRLVVPGAVAIGGVPIDLRRITTPTYIQAGREDHIAPAASVWKLMDHLSGPKRFVLAGSGHIAGVVNPPAAQKYQHWVIDVDGEAPTSFDAFVAAAREVKGSWWPDWLAWIAPDGTPRVKASGARMPGEGAMPAIENAPGRYVRMR